MNSPSETQVLEFGKRIVTFFGKAYNQVQRDEVANWIRTECKVEDFDGVYDYLKKNRSTLPMVRDLKIARKSVQESRPVKRDYREELKETKDTLEEIQGDVVAWERPIKVPYELIGKITLEEYISHQYEFDEYLTHKAAETFCTQEKCQALGKPNGYHRGWFVNRGVHYFPLKKCRVVSRVTA